jgi:AraC-like DNA-binding protein
MSELTTRPAPPLSPTTIAGYSQAIGRALSHCGVDAGRVFRGVGIPESVGNDPLRRWPVETITKLYRACVEVTHDPYFGLVVARYIQIPNLHVLGFALTASTTLQDFCIRLTRYFRLASQSAQAELRETGDEVTLRFTPIVEICPQTEDAWLGFLIMAMRHLYRSDFNPVRVTFRHAAPLEGIEPYQKLFRAPVSFGTDSASVTFARSDLLQPLAGACPDLAQSNDSIAGTYLTRLDRSDTVAAVRQKIVEFLPNGDCTREKVARSLGMSASALQAKLLTRNTSFQSLLDDTRRELAEAYASQPERTVTEMTFLLGFSDTSNFARSFKRWTGCSPSEYRKRASS